MCDLLREWKLSYYSGPVGLCHLAPGGTQILDSFLDFEPK